MGDVTLSKESGEKKDTPWRIYLYGAGFIAQHHAVAAATLSNVEIYAADPSQNARDSFSAKFPQAKIFDNATEMLASSAAQENDIVVIAVPLWLHLTGTLEAFKSKRHVLCEKPVAKSAAELAEMLAASQEAGRHFLECSIRYLGNPALDRARDLIATGSIGTPYHARLVNRQPRSRPGIEYQPESRWFLDKEKAGGGIVFDFGVYDLTMFFDVLRPVSATVHNAWIATPKTAVDPPEVPFSVETHAGASMTLGLANGATVVFDYERASGFHGESQVILNVDGTEGGLTWQWIPTFDVDLTEPGSEESFKLTHFMDVEGKVSTKQENYPAFGWNTANLRPLLSYVAMIEGRDNVALSKAKLEFNFAVVSAIYKSASDGLPVTVELQSA